MSRLPIITNKDSSPVCQVCWCYLALVLADRLNEIALSQERV